MIGDHYSGIRATSRQWLEGLNQELVTGSGLQPLLLINSFE